MKSYTKIPVICFVILQGLVLVLADKPCNEYLDEILAQMKEDKAYFQDPYEINEKEFAISKKVFLVNYTGSASFGDGHILGLSSLHRDGDVVVDRKKQTHLKVWLGAGELNMKCTGQLKLMGHGPKAAVEAKIVYINMKLDIVPTGNSSKPKVENFSIEDIKGEEIKVSGLGPLKMFRNWFINIFKTVFKNAIRRGIGNRMKSFMNERMENYTIPEDCLNETFK